jgi:signal transduction histidine kinase
MLTDAERWRQVGFVLAFAVVAPVLFGLALVPWAMILVAVIGAVSGLGSVDVLDVLFAVALLGVAPRVTLVVARAAGTFVAWFLGRDPTAELAGRVEELSVQRAEILEAVAAERRRIERNLHDGVQQQLVALGIDIGRARARIDDDPEAARALLDEARQTLRAAIGEMRVIGRGLHPAVLEDRGLDAALSSIVAASPIPITVDVAVTADLPDDAAATAYYVVSEAVANIHKHAHARIASVAVADDVPGSIRIVVHDDGRGGADASHGTGLAGMKARVEGVDGTLRIDSPPGGPTTLDVVLPVSPLDLAPVRRP